MNFVIYTLYPIVVGLSIALMLAFFLRSERFNDKLIKTEDELLLLADKDHFFETKKSFMRIDEKIFFEALQKAIGDKYYLFPQIHLCDLINVKNGIRDHENLYQLLGLRSVDYVIFSKKDMIPLLAIELNGGSHFWNNRKNRDRMVESLLNKAGINLIALEKEEFLDEVKIKKIFSLL